jgi:hypothetical protein
MLSPENPAIEGYQSVRAMHPAYNDHPATYSQSWLFVLAVIRCYAAIL